MVNLQYRSAEKELLDTEGIPFADIKKNMQELDSINRLLGGHAITIRGMDNFLSPRKAEISICEIGCGGGDNLRAIYTSCVKKNIRIKLTGIDIKQECISFAKEKNKELPATWICSDYKLATFSNGIPDVIFTSLFCHHFSREELVIMMRWMKENSRLGFFINDLHRHPLAYYSIKMLTGLFSSSYLVKNDAPLSVARGFKKADWINILQEAGFSDYSIEWKWAFRHLIVCKNG
jgi:2-polyprenyl-3-methyl-5-hydroxy-6-metoxy-1,4-benzoquinol methylase